MDNRKLRELPKVELHRHLDGSIRFETILDLVQRHNIDLENVKKEELQKTVTITEPMESLEAVLKCFWIFQKVLCSYEAVKRVTFENIEDAFRDGVRLVELRFAPAFIKAGSGIGYDEITEGVLDGLSQGLNTYPIQAGLIVIAARLQEFEENSLGLDECIRYKKNGYPMGDRICGFDLADSETEHPFEIFLPLVESARQEGLGITVHTGENTNDEYVEKSIDIYRPHRIGHGLGAAENRDLIHRIKEEGIHLELNPTSNYITRSVESLEKHPLPSYFKNDLQISINSDDPHLFGIDLVREYTLCAELFGLDERDFLLLNKRALEDSFLDPEIKEFVVRDFPS
jgi:adenosine deaminase